MERKNKIFKDETLAEKFIKRWFWLYFFAFLIAPSGYVVRLLISNDLSVEDVGVIYSIIWLLAILANYNDLGFTESLKYFLPKFWINKKYDYFKSSIFIAVFLQSLTAVIIAIWLWYFSDRLAVNYFHSGKADIVLKIFSLWFIVLNLFRTIDTIFQTFQDTFAYKFVEFVRMRSIVIFCWVIFVNWWWSVVSYSLWWFFGTLVALIVAVVIFFKKYKDILFLGRIKLSRKLLKQLFSYSVWVVAGIQAWMLLWSIDQQMIIYFLWPTQAWYYTNYLSLLNIYSLFLWPLFWFLFPVTTELAEKGQKWKLSLMISSFVKYFGILGIYWWVFIALFGTVIVFILFWKKFLYSWELLFYSWWFIFLNILIAILFNTLAWLGKVKERVKILWLAAFFNFFLNLILIPNIWTVGAVISTIGGWILIFILSFKQVLKEGVKIKIDIKFFVKNFILIFVFIVFYFLFLKDIIKLVDRFESLIYLLIIWFLYGVIILLWNLKEVKLFVREVRKILKW